MTRHTPPPDETPVLGVIADDFTGGTDIAGFLVGGGLSTVQYGGPPPAGPAPRARAVVISLKSRSCPPNEAVALSLDALKSLQVMGCRRFFFKYCSTFDSTSRGNIGPVTDALLDALGRDFTVAAPALPANGRTVYLGYLFVGGVLLSESGMRHHPVTPMLDANLMRLMEAQARGRAGNVPLPVVERGAGAVRRALDGLKSGGVRYAVLDTATDEHLEILGRAVLDLPLVTGGSGLGAGLAASLKPAGAGPEEAVRAAEAGRPADGGRAVILSGSCSQMTNAQVAAYRDRAPFFQVDPERGLADPAGLADELAAWAAALKPGPAPLISSTVEPAVLAGDQRRFGAEALSRGLETCFGLLARRLRDAGFDHFIVAGGETSGAVMQSLGVGALHIGPRIAPGVPWVRAVDAPLYFALKSGNFGDEHFFSVAQSFYQSI